MSAQASNTGVLPPSQPGGSNSENGNSASASASQSLNRENEPRGVGAEAKTSQSKRKAPCRFFTTKKGCRAGDSCPFRHDLTSVVAQHDLMPSTSTAVSASDTPSTTAPTNPTSKPASQSPSPRRLIIADPSNAVQRPTPSSEKQDPRTFQIGQITRRFSPKTDTAPNGDLLLRFNMPPSDPDFPFDITSLECTLRVPQDFPTGKRPSLRVTNAVMERGYQINVEQGFDALWAQSAAPTLLNAMKALDKQLEALLTAQKAEVFKNVPNAGSKPASASAAVSAVKAVPTSEAATAPKVQSHLVSPPPQPPRVSAQRREQARKRREDEVGILEHRLGRHPQFSKAADGTLFTVPVDPRKHTELPASLQAVKLVRLFVPSEYDVEPCFVELVGVEGAAATAVEEAFAIRAAEVEGSTLLAQVNYLAANMHAMAKEKAETKLALAVEKLEIAEAHAEQDVEQAHVDASQGEEIRDTEKDHVKVISRPPEWDAASSGSEGDSEEDSEYTGSSDEDEEETEKASESQLISNAPSTSMEKGILLSFPGLQLHGIELLELSIINLTVKCERCKDTMDIQRLQPTTPFLPTDDKSATPDHPGQNHTINTSCKKCALPYSLSYRADILHAHSIRAGYLDLTGCTPLDLLTSTFLPTCSTCSTPFPPTAGLPAVRASSTMSICRTCHAHLSFLLPEVKFLRISSTSTTLPLRARAPKKESLGLTPGTPLPARGTCAHYRHSYRWFRFSCCARVYACDRCHDAAAEADHPNEFANRMICGFCSREQVYRPESCGTCRRDLVVGRKTGFWEGGQGTRDKSRMSRKDPRKFKRVGGSRVGVAKKK